MMATVLRAADRLDQPWKNGGGRTREVVAAPASGAVGDFDWRVSMADVAVAGPFSSFPGIDRTLMVLDGRLELSFADPPSVHVLTPGTAALDFPGDVAVIGRPLDGPVVDLNLMVRRGPFRGSIRHQPAGRVRPAGDGLAALLLIALQTTTIEIDAARSTLDRFDAVHLDAPSRAAVTVSEPVLILRIDRRDV